MKANQNHSRKLSRLLRHRAAKSGIVVDEAGWMEIEAVLAVLGLTRSEIESAVAHNTKNRLEISGQRIRACQGHSTQMPVTQAGLEASWAPITADAFWHGTNESALPAILEEGLSAQARTHVHLAKAPDAKVGKRSHVQVLLEIAPKLIPDVRFFEAPNGVVLARSIPAAGIKAVHRL